MSSAWDQFLAIARAPEASIDLARAAMLLAASAPVWNTERSAFHRRASPGLDVDAELRHLDSLAEAARPSVAPERDAIGACNRLSEFLFDTVGFRGNKDDYYDPRNSYLHEVLRRRLGIPITLSLVYIETGKRLGIPLAGVGMPGHFLVRHRDDPSLYIDPFHGGILLSMAECRQRMRQVLGQDAPWDPAYLEPIGNRDYIARMVRNLKLAHLRRDEHERALALNEWLLRLDPPAPADVRDRGLLRSRQGNHAAALQDLRAYLAALPNAPDAPAVRDLIARLEHSLGS